MELEIRRRDVIVVTVVVTCFLGVVVYAQQDTQAMRSELAVLAERNLNDYLGNEDRSKYDCLSIIDCEKAYHLFGRAWGVVHVYMRSKGDENFDTFKGLEYFYKREGGRWVLLDTVGCAAKQHHIRAFDEFLKRGVPVSNHVYDKALGIDFQYDARAGS